MKGQRIFKVGQMWLNRAGALVEIVECTPTNMLCHVRRMAHNKKSPVCVCAYNVLPDGRYGRLNSELDLDDIVVDVGARAVAQTENTN